MTARELIIFAYRQSGILGDSETPNANSTEMGLHNLNILIETLAMDFLYPPSVKNVSFVIDSGEITKSIGKPIIGHPLPDISISSEIIELREAQILIGNVWNNLPVISYDEISSTSRLNQAGVIPQAIALNRPSDPYQELSLLSPSAGSWTIRITINGNCDTYELDDEMSIPSGYRVLLEYGLATRLLIGSGMDSSSMASLYNSILGRVKRINIRPKKLKLGTIQGQFNIGTSSYVYPTR